MTGYFKYETDNARKYLVGDITVWDAEEAAIYVFRRGDSDPVDRIPFTPLLESVVECMDLAGYEYIDDGREYTIEFDNREYYYHS